MSHIIFQKKKILKRRKMIGKKENRKNKNFVSLFSWCARSMRLVNVVYDKNALHNLAISIQTSTSIKRVIRFWVFSLSHNIGKAIKFLSCFAYYNSVFAMSYLWLFFIPFWCSVVQSWEFWTIKCYFSITLYDSNNRNKKSNVTLRPIPHIIWSVCV